MEKNAGSTVDRLAEAVTSCPDPCTVGLFGPAHSGKTKAVESLKKRLIAEGVPVLVYDVYKFSSDPLRSSFLKELMRQLKLLGTKFVDPALEIKENVP